VELLPKEAHKKALYLAFYAVIIVFFAYFFFEYALFVILPFALAFFIATSAHKGAEALARIAGGGKRAFSLVLGVSFFAFTALTVAFSVYKLTAELSALAHGVAEKRDEILFRAAKLAVAAEELFARIMPLGAENAELSALLTEGAKSLVSALTTKIPAFLGAVFSCVPRIFLFVATTFISCVYFCLDYDKLRAFASGKNEKSAFAPLFRLPGMAFRAAAKYLRACFFMFLIMAVVFLCGLLLVGAEYACLFAVLASLADALPALGGGAVLLPYALYAFYSGNVRLGTGLCVVWGIAAFVRQVAEPKIMERTLSVHPLVNLAAVYLGYSFFGAAGLVFMPIAVAVGKNIMQNEE
jgi:sporulation integral membrane protein YtvI